MNRPPATFQYPLRFGVAQTIGLTAPAIYSSLTFAYSYIAVPPLVSHASEKLLAKQWLQAYQYAPRFVPPLILSGTAANAYLAYHTPFSSSRLLYGSAAVLVFSIIPWTFIFFEPGVNGAAKWKVQQLLHDEGYDMPTQTGLLPSPKEHTGTLKARRWADSVTMKDIVERWAQLNANRFIVTAIATTISALATCHWIYGPLPGISS